MALRVAGAAAPGLPRTILRALLGDIASRGGGEMFEPADGSLLLVAGDSIAIVHIADRLDAIGGLPAVERRRLPEEQVAVLDWAVSDGSGSGSGSAAAPPPIAQPAAIADPAPLDAKLAAGSPTRLLRQRPIVRLSGTTPRRVAVRVGLCPKSLAIALGELAADPDLAAEAGERLAGWVLAHPEAAATGIDPALPAILPLPPTGEPLSPGLGRWIGLLPTAAAADADACRARRAALASRGWGLAIGPIDAAAVRLIVPAALGADLLLLRWSAALTAPDIVATLRTLDPRPLVLGGCDGADAIAWGRGIGIARFAGPALGTIT